MKVRSQVIWPCLACSGPDERPPDGMQHHDITELSPEADHRGPPEDTPQDSSPVVGSLTLLIYNVAGLPEAISDEHPEINNAKISPLLNDYPLVLVQEDFAFHGDLSAQTDHPYQSTPMVITETMSDGLNRFSDFPFPPVVRQTWEVCSGVLDKSNDCLAAKGFSVAPVELANGVQVLVYNLHMDAGGHEEDQAARSAQVDQLLSDIATRGEGWAVIVGGDTNLRMERPGDVVSLDRLLAEAGLADSCRTLACDQEHIDRVLFRSGTSLQLSPSNWTVPQQFVDDAGEDLSDHQPVSVTFDWSLD